MYDLFTKGGPLMWPLLLCSVASLTVTIDKFLYWWKAGTTRNPQLVDSIFALVEKGDFDQAIETGGSSPDGEVQVLLAGLKHRNHGLREALEMAAQEYIDQARRRMTLLNTVITVAPLLGILGTVMGIISSFDVLSLKGIADPKAATGGVAEALITTAAGLSVAIVTLLPFNYFVSRTRRLTTRLEHMITSFEVACRKALQE
jgi:biopolymer transport protein ExbB